MFNWKRFLCISDRDYHLDDDGFLFDPDSEYGSIANPNAICFDELKEKKCIVVLGEPGIGKSALLSDEATKVKEFASEDEAVLHFDLGEYMRSGNSRSHH